MGGATVGVAGNLSRPTVTFSNDAAKIRGHTYQVGAYGSLSSAASSARLMSATARTATGSPVSASFRR